MWWELGGEIDYLRKEKREAGFAGSRGGVEEAEEAAVAQRRSHTLTISDVIYERVYIFLKTDIARLFARRTALAVIDVLVRQARPRGGRRPRAEAGPAQRADVSRTDPNLLCESH